MRDYSDLLLKQPTPLADGGTQRFAQDIVKRLPDLLETLRLAQPVPPGEPIPRKAGVYLFSEHGVAFYVGQTRNLRQRIRDHAGATSRENQASFAFNLARKETREVPGIDVRASRKTLAAHPQFSEVFARQRTRVAAMDLRFVEIDDPALRTVFEVYAAVAFGTAEYNSFDTH